MLNFNAVVLIANSSCLMYSRAGECPIICIGQHAIQIGSRFTRIAQSLSFYKPNILNFTDDYNEGSKSIIYMKKCSKCSVSPQSLCDSCFGNRTVALSQVVSLLHNEKQISRPLNLLILCDLGNRFSSRMLRLILPFIKSCFPNIPSTCVFVKPYSTVFGLDIYFAILSIQIALSLCDALMIRGCEDSTESSIKGEYTSYGEISMSDNDERIASDLWLIVCPNDSHIFSSFIIWPLDICTRRHKIIDIRSSMYQALKLIIHQGKKKASPEYHSIRVMTANIRALHSYYLTIGYEKSASLQSMYLNIECASYAGIFVDKFEKSNGFHDLPESQCNDLGILLRSATPTVQWPFVLERKTMKARLEEHSCVRSKTKATGETVPGVDKIRINDPHFVSSIVFDSPYAKYDIATLCDKTVQLVSQRAYLHE